MEISRLLRETGPEVSVVSLLNLVLGRVLSIGTKPKGVTWELVMNFDEVSCVVLSLSTPELYVC